MESQEHAQIQALAAARDVGLATILFRNVMAQKANLSMTESLCLTLVGLKGSATPTELAKLAGLTTGAMTTLLDRLEARGIVHRRPRPGDRRGLLVEIALAHQQASMTHVAGLQKAQGEWAARFTPDQLETVAAFLTGYAANLREQAQVLLPGLPWPLDPQ